MAKTTLEDSRTYDATIRNEALSWVFEMELLSSPQAQNALVLNVFRVSSYIQDVDYVIDQHGKKMLVYAKLSKWGQWFHKEKVERQIIDMLSEVLPSYRFKVTFERETLDKVLKRLNPQPGQ